MSRKIFLETNGCLARSLDLRRLRDFFAQNHCRLVSSPAKADTIVFLGCAVIKEEEDWSVKRLNELQKYRGKLILGGCVEKMAPNRIPEFTGKTGFGTQNINAIDQFFPEFPVKFAQIPDGNTGLPRNLAQYVRSNFFSPQRIRPCYLKRFWQYYLSRLQKNFVIRIARGCEPEHCTFCSIWKALGPYESKTIAECRRELAVAQQKNIHRINLIADNLGAYGTDIGTTLPDLLKSLLDQNPQAAFLLEELSPKWFIKYQNELLELIRANRIVAVHAPLQSGSNRILKKMNRRYSADEAVAALSKIKQTNRRVQLYTDIIVGFPSETEEDFAQTLQAVKTVGFDSLSYYQYDPRKSQLTGDEIPENTVRQRIDRLTDFLWKNNIGGGPF